VNIYQFTHRAFGTGPMITPNTIAPSRLCPGVGDAAQVAELPGKIYESARQRRCPLCVEAFDMFLGAYGSEAGNLALRALATSGLYVGGGIAPRILQELSNGVFDLVTNVPVSVILNPDAGLLGAAIHARGLARKP
jgi:glucokinase